MDKRLSKGNNGRNPTPDWLKKEETVVPHTPERSRKKEEPKWAYTLTEGGKKHFIEMPKTDEQIAKVKQQLTKSRNWRRYHKNPYGGDVNYTQINCFPPFDYLRVAEVYFPTGEMWSSRTRSFHKIKE